MLSHICLSLVTSSNPKEDVVNTTRPETNQVEISFVKSGKIAPTNVEIKDQTWNMSMFSLLVPTGWTLHQDIDK